MIPPRPIAALQARLLHRFGDPSLLTTALTHRSWSQDRNPSPPDNERLEFLGDAVLGLVVAARLFDSGSADEGGLTRGRADLVRRETLARQARRIGLDQCIRLGRGEEASGGREKDSILADAFEAVVGAIYLDGGLEAARRFIDSAVDAELDSREEDGLPPTWAARGRLQEYMQREGLGTPEYFLVGSDGPSHDPLWTLQVLVEGRVVAEGSGRSKQEAAQCAAVAALAELSVGESAEGTIGSS